MEAGYSCKEQQGQPNGRIVGWDGDWDQFKWFFKASARLNGVAEALQFGEVVAEESSWASRHIKADEKQQEESEIEPLTQEQKGLMRKAIQQSPKLAAMLTMAIGMSHGPQKSVVMEELRTEENGITAWAKLIQHFERSTRDVRLDDLLQQLENEVLDEGAYPDELYTRLSGTNTKLQILKAGFQESALMRRFVAAIEKKKNHVFDGVLQEHRGMMISGRPYTIDELREFLAYVHATQAIKEEEPVIRGLATIEMCQYCRKTGHNEKQCWKKNERTKTSKVKECWQCGKKGHISKNCRRNKNVTGKAAAITKTDKVEDRKFNYLDSACSEHIVASKNLIQNMH